MNELNYTDYSFDNAVLELTNRLKAKASWKDTYVSSTGTMLIEFYAYIQNLINYYIERRAQESYIKLAQLKSSIINLVRILDYNPKRKVSSTGVLTFSLTTPITNNIYIPKYTECQTSASIKFITSEDVVLLAGQTSINVGAIQGTLENVEVTSDGSINYVYNINDTDIENTSIYITIGGVVWTEVNSFINSVSTSTHYILRTELDDTVSVIFGDNIFGKAPSPGNIIYINYIKSDGADGNVYEIDKITTLNSTITDSTGATVTLSVTNEDTFLGGDDEESIEEIRSNAPQVFATGDRAVTKEDFKALLISYPSVEDANVWGENEESAPNYNLFNTIQICVILTSWELPSSTFKTTLSNYLYDYSMMTVKYEFIDPVIIEVVPTMSIKAETTATLSQIESNIETALDDIFALGDTTKLGVSKRLSDIVKIVEDTTGVSYCYVTLEIKKDLVEGYSSAHEWGVTCDALPIKASSVKIYVNDILEAQDDGAGNIVDVSSHNNITGTVNYTTGVIGIDSTPDLDPTDSVYVRYQQDNSGTDEVGDIIVSKGQILRLDEVDITSISYIS